jgi:hypothetical protein
MGPSLKKWWHRPGWSRPAASELKPKARSNSPTKLGKEILGVPCVDLLDHLCHQPTARVTSQGPGSRTGGRRREHPDPERDPLKRIGWISLSLRATRQGAVVQGGAGLLEVLVGGRGQDNHECRSQVEEYDHAPTQEPLLRTAPKRPIQNNTYLKLKKTSDCIRSRVRTSP